MKANAVQPSNPFVPFSACGITCGLCNSPFFTSCNNRSCLAMNSLQPSALLCVIECAWCKSKVCTPGTWSGDHKQGDHYWVGAAHIDASRVEFEEGRGDAEEVLVDGHARVCVGDQARRKIHNGGLHTHTCISIQVQVLRCRRIMGVFTSCMSKWQV